MAQEELILCLSSSHSGGCGDDSGGVSSDRSRNVKQKKLPQRGLGVAQLEKIRLEEERKRETLGSPNVLANNAIDLVNDAAPCLGLSPPPSIPIQIDGGAEDTGLQAMSSSGNGGWSRLWNGDYNLGAAFPPQAVNLQLDSNSAAAMPMHHRFFCFQQPASPVVNSSLPSAVLASHLEPPSNQNVHGNNYASSWQEEYKMIGVKRAYPFSLESSFTGHFDPSSVATKTRFDELPSCSSRYTAQKEPRNMYTRDGPSKPREVLRDDDARLNGDFLSLAPPAAALPSSNSKHKYTLDNSGSHGPEENRRSQVYRLGPSRSREEPFIFFPVRSDLDETSACIRNANGEKGETIDLNLKL